MIQQQCYTRERRGLFRQSEGYDSIAKSPGLDDGFIKEYVHPFCAYNASRALQAVNAPAVEYPKALTVIHYPDGQMLLGQAVYVATDFTGQRSTFFVHNYVLPPKAAETLDTSDVLFYTAFLTAYDIEQGKEMPELSTLPCIQASTRDATETPQELLSRLGVDQAAFSKIIHYLIQALSGSKKLYIVPPVEPAATTEYAKSLLFVIYQYLPPELTRMLGFCTYNREPENKKGLHLTFLEKGVVRPGDPRVSRDLLIDLSRGQAVKTDTPTDSTFLAYIWEHLCKNQDIVAFYTFARTFNQEVSLTFWDGLTEIYYVYTDLARFSAFDVNEKSVFLHTLRQYLSLTHAACEDVDLYNFAARIILSEAISVANTEYMSTRAIMEEIAGYYVYSHGEKPMPEKLISRAMYHCALKNEAERFFITDLIRHTDIAFLMEYIELLTEKRALDLMDAYLTERMVSLPLHTIFDEMRFWLTNAPDVFYLPVFIDSVCKRVHAVTDAAQDAITTAGLAYQALKNFHTEQKSRNTPGGYDRFVLTVMNAIDTALLPRIDFDEITPEQLAALPGAFLQRGREGDNPMPFIKLEILKKLATPTAPERNEAVNMRYYIGSYRLDNAAQQYIIRKLRIFYRERIVPQQFENIVFLFRSTAKPGLDATGLLAYVDENGAAEKGAFLVWAEQAHVFNPQNPAHMDAIRLFIKNNIKDASFKETIYEDINLKTMAREVRFGRLAGML